MEKYWNRYGLLNAYIGEDVAENSPLFTYEYILIEELKGNTVKPEKEALRNFIQKSRTSKGVYNQSPEPLKGHKDDFMSHDQLTVFCAFSYKYGYDWHGEIWNEIKRQWFRYNNVDIPHTFWEKLTNKRFLHPRDIIFIGILSGSFWCKLLAPLLALMMYSSCKKIWKVRPTLEFRVIYFLKHLKWHPTRRYRHTDGKLLTFVRCQSAYNISYFKKIYIKCSKILSKNQFKDWNGCFSIYYAERDDHPINVILHNFIII